MNAVSMSTKSFSLATTAASLENAENTASALTLKTAPATSATPRDKTTVALAYVASTWNLLHVGQKQDADYVDYRVQIKFVGAFVSRRPRHRRGVCSMARTMDPNSANSQFFICLDDATFLDGQYTVWGVVTEGMEHVDALPKGEPPKTPGKIVKATVA